MTNNNGVLFKNLKYTDGSRLPYYVGTAVIDGKNKNVSAWVKKDKNGKEYLSIQISDEVKIIKEKITPVKTKNKSGKRDLDKIGTGTLDTKKQIIDITDENIPF